MAYDGIMMHQVIKELNNTITGGRINKIYQISKYELLIQIRNNQTNYKLLLSCHPMYARIQLTNLIYPTPESPNPLTMLFRKHLEGGYIKEINQIELDRICHILFGCHNEFGDYVEYHCFIEIMGKHSNIILCNENKKIIDCLKRITPNINSERFVQPGAIYYFPPVNYNKLNPFNHDFIENNNLSKVYQGMSPILSKEILFRYDNGNDFKTIMNEIKESDHLYISNTGEKEYFHLIPLTHLQVTPQIYRLFDGLDQHFDLIDQKERIKQQTSNLLKFISNEYQKNITKLSKLQATLESSKNSDEYRIIGDLLYSNLHLLKKGMKHIELDNYYDNTKIMIDLDEKLSPKANAQKYYNKYQKAKNSINVLNEQINLTKKEIEYFDSLLTLMDNASYYDALEIKEELENLGYLKKKKKINSIRKNKKPAFETYYTKDGIEICIGKNNLQNDYLTFKHAHRYDTWFHVKDMPGSHVIVKGDQLDEYTIRLASNIAAYFSKGKNSSSVPVNYTLVKTLKKPNAAKPGQVILDKYKTIYIDPDASCLEELRKK
ncbi:Rqc2 family fibronectin-binding protein [Thomasclavelia cocleata]|uniref:Rqc2 family fibronectin-binding protein n=1 Tax=Thomasclavelia cocleata TaxID=69824 RepID=UPI0024313490|nr:NFACT RNA binding domain-containing protein [Thomasclavelia cocleata]